MQSGFKHTRLAARRVFSGDQAQPGGQLAAVLELGNVTDGREEGGGRHRTDPRDGLQPFTCGMGLPDRGQLLITIDAHETGLGEPKGRPRVKLVRVPEMLDVAEGSASPESSAYV